MTKRCSRNSPPSRPEGLAFRQDPTGESPPAVTPAPGDSASAAPWRLLPFLAGSGALQMAIDTQLLEQQHRGVCPPTLRFYTWSPVAISLGYHQDEFPSHWQHLTWKGQPLDLVRRPSGGRAVLHQGDLTYAIALSRTGRQRRQAYTDICEFLIQGWRSLGIELSYGRAGRGYIHQPSCFDTATAADLVSAEGVKFIGSAQVWRGNTVLQHGSMRLAPDPELFAQVFGASRSSHCQVPLPPLPPLEEIIAALVEAATTCFGVEWLPQPWSAAGLVKAELGNSTGLNLG